MRKVVLVTVFMIELLPAGAAPIAPSAETAKRCMQYSYLLYPYKRPGSVRGSGDRGTYYRDCVAKGGNVPEPAAAKS